MRWIGRIKVNMRIYLDAIDVAPQSAVASVVLFSNWEISWLPETLGPGQLVNKHFRQYVSKGLVFVKKCWVFILQMFLSCLKNKSERMRQSYWKACSQNAESLLERFFFFPHWISLFKWITHTSSCQPCMEDLYGLQWERCLHCNLWGGMVCLVKSLCGKQRESLKRRG